jgi:hypothetical protein
MTSAVGGCGEFFAVMQHLGIDQSVGVDPRFGFVCTAARGACAACPAKERCRQALRAPDRMLATLSEFCPNAERLAYLRSCGGI